MTQDRKERKILIVASAGSVGGREDNPVISFRAHVEGDETSVAGYETWGKELVAMVKVEARLDCEITIKPNQKGEGFINRVTQMFDEKGNQVRQVQRRTGGGGSYGKTDFQVSTERISGEGLASYNGIIELLKVGVIELDAKEAKTAMDYAEKKMREAMKGQPLPAAPKQQEKVAEKPPASKEKPAEVKPAEQPEATKVDKEPEKEETPVVRKDPAVTDVMLAEISRVAKEKGYTKETLLPLVTSFGVAEGKDLSISQANKLLGKINKGEGLPEKQEPLVE